LELKVDNLELKVDNLELKVDNLELKVDNLELKVDNLELKVGNLDVKIVQLFVEGVIIQLQGNKSLKAVTNRTIITGSSGSSSTNNSTAALMKKKIIEILADPTHYCLFDDNQAAGWRDVVKLIFSAGDVVDRFEIKVSNDDATKAVIWPLSSYASWYLRRDIIERILNAVIKTRHPSQIVREIRMIIPPRYTKNQQICQYASKLANAGTMPIRRFGDQKQTEGSASAALFAVTNINGGVKFEVSIEHRVSDDSQTFSVRRISEE